MNYTKGERTIYCGEDYWLAEVKNKPDHPNVVVGKFHNEGDALLDCAAVNACQKINPNNPQNVADSIVDMYEALKETASLLHGLGYINHVPYIKAQQALSKAERKE